LDELAKLRDSSVRARCLIDSLLAELEAHVTGLPDNDRSFFTEGLAARRWLTSAPAERPHSGYLQSVPVSFPLIFVAQLAHYERLREAGLDALSRQSVAVAAGHSQGIMAAIAASLSWNNGDLLPVAKVLAPLGMMFALRMQQAWPHRIARPGSLASALKAGLEPPSPMAAVTGLLPHEMRAFLARWGDGIELTLDNTLFRQVLSADPDRLEWFREKLLANLADQLKARKERRLGGRVPQATWQYLPVSAPFHSRAMTPAMEHCRRDAISLVFCWTNEDLALPVLDTETGNNLQLEPALLDRLITLQCIKPVSWRRLCDTLVSMQVRDVLDCGPGDALSKLTYSNVRGTAMTVWPLAAPSTLSRLGATKDRASVEQRVYPEPVKSKDAHLGVDNSFTRFTHCPPVFLAGMTPTTVEAPICAAAANAGFFAELAGGGQVTEKILRLRLQELQRTLKPGRGIIFNALYLDPYLWKLHFGGARPLVVRLIEEGYPIEGVTVSAGVPPMEEAVALLRVLNSVGARYNSFKPGNDRELKEVLAIADAAADLQIIVQIEGGHAGGHHSWEDLDDLLLRNYTALRSKPNLHVAVGGGIGTPVRAAKYINGTWANDYGSRSLPVDAVFLGTVAMACLEAKTSQSVKDALVAARGTDRWIADGTFVDGVTSGRSQLDASVYYLDTSAARAGRLLDEVAGNESAVAQRRAEIIDALSKTARPYFGDIEEMTYQQWLTRLATLTAVGLGSEYEDGVWPDVSYRQRFVRSLQLAEARLTSHEGAFDSLFDDASADKPHDAIEQLCAAYPLASTERVYPDDALAFFALCKLSGKPVNFVPRIDGDVRRWYKADSLWHAHDERFSADQVLSIPGPKSLAGIERANEPIAALLTRFSRTISDSVAEQVTQSDATAPAREPNAGTERWIVDEDILARPALWTQRLASLGDSPVARMLQCARVVDPETKRCAANPLHALLTPSRGMSVTIVRDDQGSLTALRTEDREGRVRVVLDQHGATLCSYGVGEKMGKLNLCLRWNPDGYLERSTTEYRLAQRAFYQSMLFGRELPFCEPFSSTNSTVSLTPERLRAFGYATGDQPGRLTHCPPISMAFALVWEPMFSALSGALPDVTRLVHERNESTVEPAWSTMTHGQLYATASIVELEQTAAGTRVVIKSTLHAGAEPSAPLAATVRSTFFIREALSSRDRQLREPSIWDRSITAMDEAAVHFLLHTPWLHWQQQPRVGATYTLRCEQFLLQNSKAIATGTVLGDDGTVYATLNCAQDGVSKEHPVAALAELLKSPSKDVTWETPKLLREQLVTAPAHMDAYARASGDQNPLHLDDAIAALAGLEAPIVHGMWTASVASQEVAHAAGRTTADVLHFASEFAAPVLRGQTLRFRVLQIGLREGATRYSVEAHTHDADERLVLKGEATVGAPRTAYVFPGQGIQRPAMGMAGYARSPAARAVWDQAERHARKALGFSLLKVVRDNPASLLVRGERFSHPNGVLFLTQFTQVAMVVLAVAQVAELQAEGTLVPDAMLAGHSLGEYSALTAIGRVVPLEAAIEIVYARGLTMDRLVDRDATGRSVYEMRVVRPHYAALDDAALQDVVARCAREGEAIEIVNFNVRGAQYAITGHIHALQRLESAVTERARLHGAANDAKRAIAQVPGVDVPFHSTLLRDGVAKFRATLESALPADLDATTLQRRYVPNLTGRQFAVTRDEVERIAVYTGSAPLQQLLSRWSELTEQQRARTLLIELLAYQFASPVRWIDTQELLLTGDRVERVIEVGIAEQPTLFNMANQSLVILGKPGPRILNTELHASERLGPAAIEASLVPASTASAPGSASAPPAVVAPSPVSSATAASDKATGERPQRAESSTPLRGGQPIADCALTAKDGLFSLLALQVKVREEQLKDDESLDELLGGNSAKRNQVLADLGQEFGVGPIDGAHELPLKKLAESVHQKSPGYADFGKYLAPSVDSRLAPILAGARVAKSDVAKYLSDHWSLGPGRTRRVFLELALCARPGDSTRGGALSPAAPQGITDASSLYRWVDAVVTQYAARNGLSLQEAAGTNASATAVDAAALRELEQRLLGPDGVLVKTAQHVLREAGQLTTESHQVLADGRDALLAMIDAEHDESYLRLTQGSFSPAKHLHLSSAGEWVRRDALQLYYRLMATEPGSDGALAGTSERLFASIAARLDDRGRETLEALSQRAHATGRSDVAEQLASLSGLRSNAVQIRSHSSVALVTGAGPGSIANELVAQLLAEGSTVVVTTSRFAPERIEQFRQLYREHAISGAELHMLAMNQGSFADVDGLVDWLATNELLPDLLLPFGALSESASLLDVGPRSLATLRIQLLGVQRLIARLALKFATLNDDLAPRCHCVLPLSPNHGLFGGDGLYGESKAALEVLSARWKSEHSQWGRHFTLVGAKIGWVKATGLMAANDALGETLQRDAGLKIWTADQMASALLEQCVVAARDNATRGPLSVDLTAGLSGIGDLGAHASKLQLKHESDRKFRARTEQLRFEYQRRVADAPAVRAQIVSSPRVDTRLSVATEAQLASLPAVDHLDLAELTVVVGIGEVSPWGNARSRWSAERDGTLSLSALYELSWMMGLTEIAPNGALVDSQTKQLVHYHELRTRYGQLIDQRVGIRVVDGASAHGFDPAKLHRFSEVVTDQELSFTVASLQDADRFVRLDPSNVRASVLTDGTVRVHCARGAKVHVSSQASLQRLVVGQVAEGWDPTRYGIPRALAAQVDRVTLFNLVATVEAFVSAGIEPEELYRHLHISRVATTQSSGIGGMQKLRRLYHDGMMDRERQNDVLQETLINVIAGWIVQSYVGSYGPISSPVGACATAALSVAEATDLIATGRADFVVTGGCDDYNEEGAVGFADMGATADSVEALTKGISPRTLSRPNDRRRMGFVEGQGAGALLLCRGSVALAMGLPVYAIVGLAASHSDGINASVPAPGQGLLAVASETPDGEHLRENACQFAVRRQKCLALAEQQKALEALLGKADAEAFAAQAKRHLAHGFAKNQAAISPLRAALAVFGLTADDIAFVSKHDTSTLANDSNETRLHQRLALQLGRPRQLPLAVVSQKSLTGHSKGAAAAWQMIGAIQAMNDGVIPGNRSLEDVAPSLQQSEPLCFTDIPINARGDTLRACLVTSLGFGHVGALVCLIHRNFFWKILSESQREQYLQRLVTREQAGQQRTRRALAGTQPLYTQRTTRPFVDKENSDRHLAHEAAVLLDASARRSGAVFSHASPTPTRASAREKLS
jgi:fatty acid synthase